MQAIKGMVQVGGATFRIVRISAAHYEVVRVLDDICVGTFCCTPQLAVEPRSTVDAAHLREIARAAIKGAKTSWVGRLANFGDQLPSSPRT